MEPTLNTPPDKTSLYNTSLHSDLSAGSWEALYQTCSDWLRDEPDQPVAKFIQNIACLFVNPPDIIRNKKYLSSVANKDWKIVLNWFKEFYSEQDQHNPYFQALDFILQPNSKKKATIETALQENPGNAELLFFQALSLRDHSLSIGKLKLAIENKPEFPAAIYMLGIFSLEMNQVEAAENYLKQAIALAPDFLEAHYQLGSLYSMYIPDSIEKTKVHFQKVIDLDPEGGAGQDAKKVLENNSKPQYGQRAGSSQRSKQGGMSMFTILGITLLAVWLFSGPVANIFHLPPFVGIVAGMFVFVGLYSAKGRRK